MQSPFGLSAIVMLAGTVLQFPVRLRPARLTCPDSDRRGLDLEQFLTDSTAAGSSAATDIVALFFS